MYKGEVWCFVKKDGGEAGFSDSGADFVVETQQQVASATPGDVFLVYGVIRKGEDQNPWGLRLPAGADPLYFVDDAVAVSYEGQNITLRNAD